MKHRISAGMLLVRHDKLLLVRHVRAGRYDFWVAPGGGVQGAETLEQAAAREVKEETGLAARAAHLAYIEEFHEPETRHCKFWFVGQGLGGRIDTSAPEAAAEHIVEAAWFGQNELAGRLVFPECLLQQFWHDRERGHATPRYLGLRAMQFW